MKISRLFLPFLLAIAGCATQNPPAKIDMERQAKIEKALKELKDGDANAVSTLGQLGAKEYAKDIAKLLKDKEVVVRSEAALALGVLGAKEYAKDISEFLKDENRTGRIAAVRALRMLGTKEYAKDISELLKDEDVHVRAESVRALGKLDAREYKQELVGLLSDSAECVVYNDIKTEPILTTVSKEAEGVLKKWGYNVEKLKEKK